MKPIFIPQHKMNKTELAYSNFLERRKLAGEIVDYLFEPIKFKLAPKTFYTPDFMVIAEDSFELHEVKGFWRDDARVKIKVAAKMFPWFKWRAVQLKRKQWVYEPF